MSSKREYEIPYVGLKPGIHEFEYQINDRFFEAYPAQEFENCKASVKLTLDKKVGFLLLKFEVGGQVKVSCDRCGNNLPLELWDEFKIVAKLADDPDKLNEQEEDPDVYYISRTESHLHIADWIFEFINLSIPMQKMCKAENIGGPYCNQEVLATLRNMDAENQRTMNPVWKGLEKFKDLE